MPSRWNRRTQLLRGLVGAGSVLVFAGAAYALEASADQTERPQDESAAVNARRATGADEVDGPTILEGIPALNGLDAARDDLRDRFGFYLHGQYVGDPYGVLSGGLARGATYSGRLDVELDVDTDKVAGLPGGTVHANMYQIHGRDLSAERIGNFLTIDDIAALPTTRLYELWYEQKLGDALAIRAGQQGIDVEFLTSDYAASFINSSFGWPGLVSEDLPDGGPAYPLATPALRVKLDPAPHLSILAAVFDGMPAGPCLGNPEVCDRYGLNFRVSDPPLVFLETQYRYNRGEDAAGLPGTLKLGAFSHFGSFADQRFPTSPIVHSPDGGAYAILDQQVYRPPGERDETNEKDDADQETADGIGIFTRVIVAPPDRNLVDFYADAGVSALGLVPGRPHDLFGVAGIFAKISSDAVAADESAVAAGVAMPIRRYEAVLEATYRAEIVPGLSLQPTFQYIVHPGGHIADPFDPARSAIPNAKVAGVTLSVRF